MSTVQLWQYWKRWGCEAFSAVALVTFAFASSAESLLVRLSLGLAIVALYFVLRIPQWQARAIPGYVDRVERFTAENAARQTAIQVLGGLLLLFGGYSAWRQFQDTLRLTRQGQITERFKDSVALLGNRDSPAVRLGGVYALEGIAAEWEPLQRPIVDLLSALIRNQPSACEEAAEDVEAALSVLGRRRLPATRRGDRPLDLRRACLARTDLQVTRLGWVLLTDANLEGASLKELRLERRSDLMNVKLRHALLEDKPKLAGVNLYNADLQCTILRGADLSGASLVLANLRGAQLLDGGTLENADLTAADLSNATLFGINVRGVDFQRADLRGADIQGLKNGKDVRSLWFANLHGVRHAPSGFLAWALRNGAVEIASDEEWYASLRKQNRQPGRKGDRAMECLDTAVAPRTSSQPAS